MLGSEGFVDTVEELELGDVSGLSRPGRSSSYIGFFNYRSSQLRVHYHMFWKRSFVLEAQKLQRKHSLMEKRLFQQPVS